MTQKSLTQPKAVLTNADVEAYLAMQETRKSLKARLELIEQSVEKAEVEILAKIEAGADSSACGYKVSVDTVTRRYPKWKEEFLSRCGKEEADRVTSATPATVYKRLVIA